MARRRPPRRRCAICVARHALRGLLDAQPRLAVTWYQLLRRFTVTPFVAAARRTIRPRPSRPAPACSRCRRPPASSLTRTGMQAWHAAMPFPGDSVFDAAKGLGLTTATLGDVYVSHLGSAIDASIPAQPDFAADPAGTVATLAAAHTRLLAVVALGGPAHGRPPRLEGHQRARRAVTADRRHRRAPARRARHHHQRRRHAD